MLTKTSRSIRSGTGIASHWPMNPPSNSPQNATPSIARRVERTTGEATAVRSDGSA